MSPLPSKHANSPANSPANSQANVRADIQESLVQGNWPATWIAQALELELPASAADKNFNSIITDSRKVRPGCLFVAIPGETFDGHDFIEKAIEQGASAIVCRTNKVPMHAAAKANVEFFAVADTMRAYCALGHAWRKRFDVPVILVAGSNGKTTTKEILAAILRGRFNEVHRTQGSQNGFVGIPLTLLEMNSSHAAAVIEVGIDEPGAMIQHVKAVEPTISVLTVVAPEHMEKLLDLETVAFEEGLALTEVAAQGGAVAICCDDPLIAPHYGSISTGRKLGYTLSRSNDPSLLQGALSTDDPLLQVIGAGWSACENFELPLPGRHNAMNLLAAIAVAHLMGLTAEEMRKGLATFQGAEGRSQVRTLSDRTQVICDYYNSQPASLRAGLELLNQQATACHSPRWACLGDMLELGTQEERYHREPSQEILSSGIENVVLYGPRMKWLADELQKKGFQGTLKHFESHAEVAQMLIREVRPESVVLIKGSRGMKMEEVWKPFEQARK